MQSWDKLTVRYVDKVCMTGGGREHGPAPAGSASDTDPSHEAPRYRSAQNNTSQLCKTADITIWSWLMVMVLVRVLAIIKTLVSSI